jgi:hypothetical protein
LVIATSFWLRVTFSKLCHPIFRSDTKPISKEAFLRGILCRFAADEFVTEIGDRRVLSAARAFSRISVVKISERHQTQRQRGLLGGGFYVGLLRMNV